MNLQDLTNTVAEKNNITKVAAKALITDLFATIAEGAKSGRVAIPNFGAFEVKESAARVARNPLNGETVSVPAKQRLRFRSYVK